MCLLLDGVSKIDALNMLKDYDYNSYYTLDSVNEYKRILSGDIINLSSDEIKSSGYVVNTLEASLWCLLTNDNYSDSVLSAVNLGGDTETIAAITGGLCGIIYGKKNIPNEWLIKLRKRKYIEDISRNFSNSLNNTITMNK